ncbi:MAG: pseudouridine synthase [Oscillospiraceae bacterium]
MKPERLDKILCGTGMFSRAEARKLITSGLVTVDGAVVRRPEEKVSRAAAITAKGEPIDGAEFVYYMLNKPAGYVSASKPEGEYPPVTSLLPEHLRNRGVQCVGRLDVDVTGLLLLTDDGSFVHRVTAPRSEIAKVYAVQVDGPLSGEDVTALAAGTVLQSGVEYRPARLSIQSDDPCRALIEVTEGKYHEVKNLMAVRGRKVVSMSRVSIGGLALDASLGAGQFRALSAEEREQVFF